MATTADVLLAEIRARDRASADIKKVERSFGKLQSSVIAINQAVQLAGTAFRAFSGVVQSTIAASAKQATIEARLAQAIERTGGSYAAATKQINAFAAAQQDTTRFGDDETKKVLTTLISLTGSYGDHTIMAAQAVQDFAEGSQQPLTSASRLVSQAIAGNISALTRYIPSLRGMKAEAFAALTIQERTQIVTNALAGAFGGAATALDPLELGMARLKNKSSDVAEAFGDALRQSGALQTVMDTLTSALSTLEGAFKDNSKTIGEGFALAVSLAAQAARPLLFVTKGLVQAFQTIAAVGGPVVSLWQQLADATAKGGGLFRIAFSAERRQQIVETFEAMYAGLQAVDPQIEATDKLFTDLGDEVANVAEKMAAFRAQQEAGGKKGGMAGAPPPPRQTGAEDTGLEFEPLDIGQFKEATQAADDLRGSLLAYGRGLAGATIPSQLFRENLASLVVKYQELKAAHDAQMISDAEYLAGVESLSEALQNQQEDWEARIDVLRRNAEEQEKLRASAVSLATDMKQKLASVLPTAQQFGSALEAAITAVVDGKQSFASALRNMTASLLTQIGKQAAVKAIFELAEGIAKVARSYGADQTASGHFTAAAMFGSIAIGGIAGGRAVAGGGGGGGDRDRSDAFRAGSGGLSPEQRSRRGSTGDVNVFFGGQPVHTKEEVGSVVVEAVNTRQRSAGTGRRQVGAPRRAA